MRHDLFATGNRRQRKPAADHLSQGADVRNDAIVFLGAPIGEAKARHNLVEDQRNAILPGDLPQALQEFGFRCDQALHRLDDHATNLVVMRPDQVLRRR